MAIEREPLPEWAALTSCSLLQTQINHAEPEVHFIYAGLLLLLCEIYTVLVVLLIILY